MALLYITRPQKHSALNITVGLNKGRDDDDDDDYDTTISLFLWP